VIAEYKLLLYGGLLFAVMRFSPGGLAGLVHTWMPRPGGADARAEERAEP
jgi:branched-chain amino acid transport system permease protein